VEGASHYISLGGIVSANCGFDEVTEFTEHQFRFVNAWNRSTRPGQRCRVVAAGNPPTSSDGQWVIRYWGPWLEQHHPHPAKPGELRWFARLDNKDVEVQSGTPFQHNGELIAPRSRTFIPARLSDNPILETTGYRATLQSLPEPLRSQLLYGDFSMSVEDDLWQVIPTDWVRRAQARWTPEAPAAQPLSAVGVDVARGGKDKTVIAKRYGPWFAQLLKFPGKDTPDGPTVGGLVLREHRDDAMINIDVIGIGSSAYDWLRSHRHVTVNPVNNAEGTALYDKSRKFRLVNVRAASYWMLREALDPNGPERLALPPDPELLADLCAPRYKVTSSGIAVEPKPDIIQRLGRSPDCGDACVLAHWMGFRSRHVDGDLFVYPELPPETPGEATSYPDRRSMVEPDEPEDHITRIGGVEIDWRDKELWE
jgi:hypothetical protein